MSWKGVYGIMNNEEQTDFLNKIADIFLWCFLFTLALLFVWFFAYLVAGNWMYSLHSNLFTLSKHDFDLLMYYGMAYMKVCGFLLFLFPYLAIKLVLHNRKKKA